MEPLTGLVAAPHTPFDARGDLALDRVPDLARHLEATGVRGVFVNGTTGEGQCQTVEERCRTAEAWAAAKGSLHLIVNLGAQAVGDLEALARHAGGLEVDGVAIVAPSFHRPRSVDALVDLAEVAALESGRPLWLYHIPALSGVHLDATEVCEALHHRLEHFAGVKFTANDLLGYQRVLAAGEGRWQAGWGCDELLLPALAMGARFFVGSTYSYAAPTYLRLMAAFEAGDLDAARRESRRIPPLLEVLERFGQLHAGKRLMARWGLDLGLGRPPEPRLDAATLAELERAIDGLELMDDAPGGSQT